MQEVLGIGHGSLGAGSKLEVRVISVRFVEGPCTKRFCVHLMNSTCCQRPSRCQVTSLLSVDVEAVAVCELGAMLATKSTASCPWDS